MKVAIIIIYAEGALSSIVQQFIMTLRSSNIMLLTLISNFNDRHHPTAVIVIFDSLISAEAMIYAGAKHFDLNVTSDGN